jgi:curved DNA-binding protein
MLGGSVGRHSHDRMTLRAGGENRALSGSGIHIAFRSQQGGFRQNWGRQRGFQRPSRGDLVARDTIPILQGSCERAYRALYNPCAHSQRSEPRTMEYRDYYKILGVERTAGADDIKKSYRRLARKFHPDVSKEKDAEARFKEVQEAYEVLKDPEKRAAYDQLGSNWKSGEQFRPPPDWASGFEFRGGPHAGRQGGGARRGSEEVFEDEGFSDFFSSLFGGGAGFAGANGPRAARAGRDHHAGIDIDLEEAFAGTTRTIELKRPQLKSDGTLELKPHTVRVTIPAGVTEGQPIRLAGQGEVSPNGGRAGDLYLEVHIRPDKLFQLEGRDVTLTLPVAPWEAALGGSVKVPTLAGTVEMSIPAGAQSGQKLRLRGRGLPGQPAGDQYVQLKVVLPPANSPEARALYEEMRRKLGTFDPRADLVR